MRVSTSVGELAGAYHVAFWVVVAFTVLTCLSAFRLPNRAARTAA